MSGELYWAVILLSRDDAADVVLKGPLLVVAQNQALAQQKVATDNPSILGKMDKAYVVATQFVTPGLQVIKDKLFKPEKPIPPGATNKRPTPVEIVRHADEGGSWGTGTHHSGE